jgi:hypothetical protein
MIEVDSEADTARRARGRQQFARDVLINVLANLIAAAVIYLAGAIAGVLPRRPGLIFVSVTLLIAGLGFAAAIAGVVTKGPRKSGLHGIALALLSIVTASTPFVPGANTTLLDKIGYPASGLIGLYVSIYVYRQSRQRLK